MPVKWNVKRPAYARHVNKSNTRSVNHFLNSKNKRKMERISYKTLLEGQVHFGHLKRKWNPKMLPYIFGEKKGIHIIDLNRTAEKLEEAAQSAKSIARSGR